MFVFKKIKPDNTGNISKGNDFLCTLFILNKLIIKHLKKNSFFQDSFKFNFKLKYGTKLSSKIFLNMKVALQIKVN